MSAIPETTAEYNAHVRRTMKEEPFTAQVIDMARTFGWFAAHFRPAKTAKGWRTPVQGDGKGFPDLVMLRRERMVVAELKRHGEKPTAEQEVWLAAFRLVPGAEVFVWRPVDMDAIEEVLR